MKIGTQLHTNVIIKVRPIILFSCVDLIAEIILTHVFSTLTGNSALNLLLPFSHLNQVDDVIRVMQWMRKATKLYV